MDSFSEEYFRFERLWAGKHWQLFKSNVKCGATQMIPLEVLDSLRDLYMKCENWKPFFRSIPNDDVRVHLTVDSVMGYCTI